MSLYAKVILLSTLTLGLTFLLLIVTSPIFGFSSTSTNYKVEGEFGEFGGSKSSANYAVTDTGGGFAIGFGSSANYGTGSGFQYVLAEIPEISFTISASSINLGTLSTGSVSTGSHTVSVTTNAGQGYVVKVYEDGNLRNGGSDIDDVADGAVTANNEEYGLATSDSGQEITQDTSCGSAAYNATAVTTTPKSVSSASLPVTADSATICYAASISGTTVAGSYSHILTYIATGTF